MEIKAKLNKPYTEEEKINFIAENNHKLGYIIEENPNALLALGKTEEEETQDRENEFKSKFFQIPTIKSVFVGGWYRKTPKGYQSAVESLNSAFHIVNILGKLPANILQFYIKPDFTKPEECKEEWFIEHAFKNDEMSVQQFGAFYAEFLTAWNREEH